MDPSAPSTLGDGSPPQSPERSALPEPTQRVDATAPGGVVRAREGGARTHRGWIQQKCPGQEWTDALSGSGLTVALEA